LVAGLLPFPGIVAFAAFPGAVESCDPAPYDRLSAFKAAAQMVNVCTRIPRVHSRRSTYLPLPDVRMRDAAPWRAGSGFGKSDERGSGKISGTGNGNVMHQQRLMLFLNRLRQYPAMLLKNRTPMQT
jgi:hypothetical protein